MTLAIIAFIIYLQKFTLVKNSIKFFVRYLLFYFSSSLNVHILSILKKGLLKNVDVARERSLREQNKMNAEEMRS